MTRDLEPQLNQMFADLDEDLPSADFTSQVMSELLKPRRRERRLWSTAILAALACLLFVFPELAPDLRIVAGFPIILLSLADDSVAALLQTPLVYIYGTAFGGYVLLRLLRRLQVRLM
jgi:hypothetical protein